MVTTKAKDPKNDMGENALSVFTSNCFSNAFNLKHWFSASEQLVNGFLQSLYKQSLELDIISLGPDQEYSNHQATG